VNFATLTATDYTGQTKQGYELGYACDLSLCSPSGTTVKPGATISSSVSRRSITVTFNAVVAAALAAIAITQAAAMTPATLATAIQQAAASLNINIPLPTAQQISVTLISAGVAPVVSDGSSKTPVWIAVGVCSAVTVLIIIGVAYYVLRTPECQTQTGSSNKASTEEEDHDAIHAKQQVSDDAQETQYPGVLSGGSDQQVPENAELSPVSTNKASTEEEDHDAIHAKQHVSDDAQETQYPGVLSGGSDQQVPENAEVKSA